MKNNPKTRPNYYLDWKTVRYNQRDKLYALWFITRNLAITIYHIMKVEARGQWMRAWGKSVLFTSW